MQSKAKMLLMIYIISIFADHVSGGRDYWAWKEFKSKYNKVYGSKREDIMRKKIFLDNKRYIEEHNFPGTQVVADGSAYSLAINHLSDLTSQEIDRLLNGFRFPKRNNQPDNTDGRMLEHYLQSLNSSLHQNANPHSSKPGSKAWWDFWVVPQSVDWRDRGWVSEVKDQVSCANCWAFAVTGAIESQLATGGQHILLSEQNLLDCTRGNGKNGCETGFTDYAFEYVRDYGIMSAANYKYTAREGSCKFNPSKSVTRVSESWELMRNENLVRLIVALVGPIPVAIDARARSFKFYKSGVYNDRACGNSKQDLNHAVLIVGYGHDSVQGDYWLVKNSWGEDWGESGYIKMARNRGNLCGIVTHALLPVL